MKSIKISLERKNYRILVKTVNRLRCLTCVDTFIVLPIWEFIVFKKNHKSLIKVLKKSEKTFLLFARSKVQKAFPESCVHYCLIIYYLITSLYYEAIVEGIWFSTFGFAPINSSKLINLQTVLRIFVNILTKVESFTRPSLYNLLRNSYFVFAICKIPVKSEMT